MGKLELKRWWNWGPLMTWWGNWPLILFKRFNTAPLHSFKLMGPNFNWDFRCHVRGKRIYRALILHCSSYISKILWWLPMFDFGIFCHLLRLMGIYRVRPPSGYLRSFVLSFFCFFFFFFSFLSFIFFFFVSLGGLFSSGAPGHCPPMPPSRYATEFIQDFTSSFFALM